MPFFSSCGSGGLRGALNWQGADPLPPMLTARRRSRTRTSVSEPTRKTNRGNAMAEETATLAAYVADLRFDDIPPEVRERAKVLTLDFLGSAIRARRDAESTPSLLKMLEALALDGSGESTVFGDAKTWTPAVAALLNGALGHSLDFDDTHADSSLHPSAPVVPAAFAVGELVGASGRDVLTAIVAGYEVCCRLGNALDPTSHYARGFHPTATAGTYGAAAAAAKLFGLSKQQIIAAFGVSGSQAAGSLQFLVNGAWNKRYQVGAAAMNGVIAATLARNDFVGSSESVEGKHGLLVGYSDNAHPDKATAGLGKIYETMKIGVKPYPSCRYTHAALDALIAMRREHNLTPDQIRRVEIGLHRNGITLTGDAATKRHPTSIVGGQFSMFFTGAVALDQGRFGWDDYERLGDAAVDALADKFDVVQDDRLEVGRSHPFGARVSITTDDGVHERLYADPSGEPASFPDAQAMAQKFLTLARPVLQNRADQLADAILSLERFDRVATATHLGRQ
jgi:2-methylcitrate dehydratase PrpD